MSMADPGEARPPEIIIVRRGGGDEDDDAHSSAWKIAFADFMTAMMCFFLVMWLINAANEQTRAALASYFNPVKLIDRNTSRKGVEEIGQGPKNANPEDEDSEEISDAPAGSQDQTSGPMSHENAKGLSDEKQLSDENLFSDPYSVLAEIAADTGTKQNISEKGEGGAQNAGPSSGASGGESYRDPFAPDFWSQQVATPRVGVQGDPDEARELPAGHDIDVETNGRFEFAGSNTEPGNGDKNNETDDAQEGVATEKVAELPPLEAEPQTPPEASTEQIAEENPDAKRREALADDLRRQLAERFTGSPLAGSVEVVSGEDGIIVSITDDLNHGMFPIGSAVPERELVLAMEKIGDVLSAQPGRIKIGGHTDGRPFKSETYDNWRLSTARAHAAYYMLVRGGIAEARIDEVAGFADRKLKLPDEPYASVNRRIEVLLEPTP